MRSSVRAPAFALAAILTLPSLAHAAPGSDSQFKERVESTESTMTRDQALALLVEAEQLLTTDRAAEAMLAMLEVYIVLESTDGPEAPGVKELRSWLVKALETIALPDEAKTLRQRGSYVDHPLSVMPSTWFKASGAVATSTMTNDQALAAVEQGLGRLERGDVEGLAMLIDAYFAIEQQQGAESEDAKALRSFLVGLLETGGFTEEAANLRLRGSVVEANSEDVEVYAATWLAIINAEQGGSAVISGIDKSSMKSSGSSGTTTDPGTIDSGTTPDPGTDDPGDDPYKPRIIEKGSPVPSVGIDLGIGSFQPTVGTKGLIWTLGLDVRWTLFRAKFFGMQLGGAGTFGRNRDKRWLTDVWGGIGLLFDFEKVYFVPEFGGGYDGVAGGKKATTEALRWAPAGYYQFGGRLGVRFAERFGLYGRAMRVNRVESVFANETRVRGGFLIYFDKAALDLAFVFTDFESKSDTDPSARMFGGILGFRI